MDASRGLTVKGHADAAPKGQDLVCCAVSTLVQTLATGLKQTHDETVYWSVKPGDAHFCWFGPAGPSEQADVMIGLVVYGLTAIATDHPDHVLVHFPTEH